MEWILNRKDTPSIWHRLESAMNADIPYVIPTASSNKIRTFRITPLSRDNRLNTSVVYHDGNLFKRKKLDLELGADLKIDYKKDNQSAANLVNEMWVDSLKYRENFDFLALNLTPKAKLSYSQDKFGFSLLLTPDFYISKLDSDRNIGNFNFGRVYLLSDFYALWARGD